MSGSWGEVTRIRYVGLVSAAGLVALWGNQRATRADRRFVLSFFVIQSLAMLSSALFRPLEALLNLAIITGVIGPFVHAYLIRHGFGRAGAAGLALGLIPNLLPGLFAVHDAPVGAEAVLAGKRFTGAMGDPNGAALSLLPVLAGLLILFFGERSLLRWPLAALAGVAGWYVLATGSRAGVGAMAVALVCALAFGRGARHVALAAALAVVAWAVLGVSSHQMDFFRTRVEQGYFVDDRYQVWQRALEYVVEAGPFASATRDETIARFGMVVHNFLLDIGLTFGWAAMMMHAAVWTAAGASLSVKALRLRSERRGLADNFFAQALMLCAPALAIAFTLTVGTLNVYWLILIVAWSGVVQVRNESRMPGRP